MQVDPKSNRSSRRWKPGAVLPGGFASRAGWRWAAVICLAVGCLLAYGLRPPSLDSCRQKSRAALAAGRFSEALEESRRVLRRQPADPTSLCVAGEVLQKLRRPAEAVTYLDQLPDDGDEFWLKGHLLTAVLNRELGRATAAEAARVAPATRKCFGQSAVGGAADF